MELKGICAATVYLDGLQLSLSLQPRERFGRRVIGLLSDAVPAGAVMKIDCADSLVFAEVQACWREQGGIHVVVHLLEMLAGSRELACQYPWAYGQRG